MPEVSRKNQALALQLMLMFPPKVRDSLASSATFRSHYGLARDATLSSGNSGISFKRSELYAGARQLYSENFEAVEVASLDGRKFNLSLEEREGETVIVATYEGERLLLPPFWFLSPDAERRVVELDREVATRNLSGETIAAWRERLAGDPLDDDEVNDLHDELKLNPQEVAGAIANEVKQGESQISVLVPRSAAYYERLIGPLGNTTNAEAYIAEQVSARFDKLLRWDFARGLAQCLLFCAHPSMAPLIDLSNQDSGKVEEFFRWLEAQGDRFSQVAGFEVGIGLVDRFPDIEPYLINIATKIRDDDPDEPGGRLKLTSSLCIFVDGELARIGLLRGKPPFWRRLAAIAQASLIERELIEVGVQSAEFADWATKGRGQHFYMQSLADLRLEPRWLPDLLTPKQLRYEFLSRLNIAAHRVKEQISSEALRRIVLDDGPESVRSSMEMPFAALPGPLEGASKSQQPFPEDMIDELRKVSDSAVLEARFFSGVINLALVFRLEPEIASLIAAILRKVKYRLSLGSDTDVTFSLLTGLAIVAAVTRSPELAEEVRILSRVLRRRDNVTIDADNQMRIGLIACAASEDLNAWCKTVGDWFLEIAYEDIDHNMAAILRSHLRTLCQFVPQLWRSCGAADAALSAIPRKAS